VPTDLNPVTDAVAITATQILRADPKRTGFTIINSGDRTILLAPDPAPGVANAITLNPQGSAMTVTKRDDHEMATMPWWAIALLGAGTITTYAHTDP
jgi:hypothetical protein